MVSNGAILSMTRKVGGLCRIQILHGTLFISRTLCSIVLPSTLLIIADK
jgi:hypothetical protein